MIDQQTNPDSGFYFDINEGIELGIIAGDLTIDSSKIENNTINLNACDALVATQLQLYDDTGKEIYRLKKGTVEIADWNAIAKMKDSFLENPSQMNWSGILCTALWKAKNDL